jgi:DNA-binding NtrC family response regulator
MTRILLVDDETIILSVLASFFRAWDYDVIEISNSSKAVELLESNEKFDVMVSDIRMIPVNGIELLTISRKKRPGMPVILITGFSSRETHKQAMELGAFDCLSKPFEPEMLVKKVEESIKAAKVQEQYQQ